MHQGRIEAGRKRSVGISGVNFGQLERVASATAGGLLVTEGLRRRSLGGVALTLAGGDLLYRGFSGHCHVYQALGTSTASDDGASQP